MAESFVDTFKTELIADRVWRTPTQLEFAIVAWVGWYNQRRLHSALGDVPPAEYELEHAPSNCPRPCSADLDQTACGPLIATAGAGRAGTDAS